MGMHDDILVSVQKYKNLIGVVVENGVVELFQPLNGKSLIKAREFNNAPIGCMISFNAIYRLGYEISDINFLPRPVNFKIVINDTKT